MPPLELATRGAEVLVGGTDPQHLEDALASFASVPGKVEGILADVGTKEGVLEMFEAVDGWVGWTSPSSTLALLSQAPS